MVSVIVPVYNAEKTLHNCIDSILCQTYTEFELILVDDGSTDHSGEFCDCYAEKDNRIIVIHQSNSGVSAARNNGIEISQGEYICFVDSDDRIKNNFLSEMVNVMQNDKAGMVICGYEVRTNKCIVSETLYHNDGVDYCTREDVVLLLGHSLFSAPWCKLFRSDIIKDNNLIFPEDISLGEDLIFNILYTNYVLSIVVYNKSLYEYYTDNNNSLLRKYRRNLLDEYRRINEYVLCYLKEWNVSSESIRDYRDAMYFQYENVLFNTFSEANTDTFFTKLEYNNEILRSVDFQNIYSLFSGRVNVVFKFAYRMKNFFPIYLYSLIRKVIKR